MNRKKVLLGMSGGVDSSTAAILLQEQGYEVIGITLNLWEDKRECTSGNCGSFLAAIDAKKVCDELGIPHIVLEYKKEFKEKVIDDFINKYSECKTPNPCVECNRHLKFAVMYEHAKKLGIEYIATGHYARTSYSEKYKRYAITKSKSDKKDQTYVLYNIPSEIVEHIVFPLGEFRNKEEIREKAKQYNLNVASKPDSQEICFIPDNDYMRFLEEEGNITKKPGDIVAMGGEIIGSHEGLYRYTIGQRKGIHTKSNAKLYVIKLDKEKNQLVVGDEGNLFSKELYINDVNLLLIDELKEPMKVMAKIRYLAKESPATIYPIEAGRMKVEFNEPQRAATPGQSLVFYVDDYLLGGGKIEEVL